ncbi:DUF3861 domain-containing protein [Vitreoscilla massiliensis]|uniref:DUF3861 domain-containing protein n=1 Tax=Vitreoscilla massiliensis TaxID=1689272 RepID=A0ABY4E559_9NEIS|nr:DUF3861 family protein [Vitreoscilla massiliensis]UOO90894.1 DUF3861 domain-containing protein [Vitreoscilla massiliensis]
MSAHQYRISVEKIEASATRHVMTFAASNHDDIEKVLQHLQRKLPVSKAEQQAFAVGLKLFSEVVLKHRNEAPFDELFGIIGSLMRTVKQLPDVAPTAAE